MTIYATCFQGFLGVKRHLQELQQFDVKYISLNQLYKVTNNDIVIFGAWEHNSYPLLIRRSKAKKKCLLWTSPLLQSQMNEPELDFLETILKLKEKKVIDYLLFADEETYEVFKDDRVFHLPHPADPNRVEIYRKDTSKTNIFCFMPWGNKNKNQICQLAAVKFFQEGNPNAALYTNGMGYWKKWADKLVQYVDLGFLPENEYYETINRMACGLHVTLSESFGYCILDAFLLSVPVLCSPTIYWAPNSVITINPDDPISIANDLEYVYDEHSVLGEDCRKAALNIIGENNIKVKDTLARIIQ